MQRGRLNKIIEQSKKLNNNISPFDQFKESLPKNLKIDENYRLESAWKAYGSPKDYKQAIWEGMIQPIGENEFKFPSIGYNEETEEYEYLNKGKENETIAKDIRVWDNDVIPFVQELKKGGYVRTFNEEKDCWTYSKNIQERKDSAQIDEQQVIEEFQKGGNFKEWYKKVPKDKSNTDDYDLERAYNELSKTEEGQKELEEFINNPEKHLSGDYKKSNHPTYGGYGGWINKNNQWHYYISPIQIENYPERNFDWYKNYWDQVEPNSVLHWIDGKTYNKGIEEFKQGGQMNVIPEGALHARKNNMELAKEGEVTHKGIPVVDNDGNQQAEVEKEEWTMTKELTEAVEKWYKKYFDEETSQKEKDELSLKCGKRIVEELLHNTDDRAGIIERMEKEL